MNKQVAIVAGLASGLIFGIVAAVSQAAWMLTITEWMQPVGRAFIRLVQMAVIPLVATTLFTGVASLTNIKRLGKLGGATLAFFWITTIISISLGMALMSFAVRLFTVPQIASDTYVPPDLPSPVEFFVNLIPANPFQVAAEGALLPLVIFTVLFAAAVGTLKADQKAPLLNFADAVTNALIVLVHWVLWTAPIGVFALAAPVATNHGMEVILSLAVFIVTVIVGLGIFLATVYMPAVVILGKVRPGRFAKAALETFTIGASTTSSVATFPAMLEAALGPLKISKVVAGLVLSLGSSLNRAGSSLFQGGAIVFLAELYNVPLPLSSVVAAGIATFFVSLSVAPVPSASLVTLAPALDAAGVPLHSIGILFGIDRIPDMARSATNVTGHLVTATVVEQVAQREGQKTDGTIDAPLS